VLAGYALLVLLTAGAALGQPSDPFLERARRAALSLAEVLPNFVVTQETTRETRRGGSRRWDRQDRISAELVYENGHETARNILVNGKPPAERVEDTGAWSTGEFGARLISLFAPETEAVFTNPREEKLQGRPARVYDFSAPRETSRWSLSLPHAEYVTGYEGTIWLDPDSARALRLEMRARGIPEAFPIARSESSIDYGLVRAGESEFILPLRSVSLNCARLEQGREQTPAVRMPGVFGPRPEAESNEVCGRNTIEFRKYRRFGAESSIRFQQ
jgi:hypothetical protein